MEKPKILIIDDEQELLDLLQMTLELEGYEIETAVDGEEGLKKVASFKPNLIICDIIMPKKDGYEVLKAVKKNESGEWIPFIMLSAIADMNKIKEAYEGETDFYLTKPVETWVLTKNIKTLLNLAKLRQG
jgi:CheY-like chemotaxis protein